MAEAFLQLVLDKLISLINREIGLLFDEVMKMLCSTLTTIQTVLEDAVDKQTESKAIRNWLQKLNAIAYEVDDVLDDCNTHVSKLNYSHSKYSSYSLKKILYRHNIARRMKQVNEKVEAIAAERDRFHLREMPVHRPREVALASRETVSLLNEADKIHGREEGKDKIVKILVNDVKEKSKMSVLSIIGVRGLGKTTLARLVFNDPQVEEHFVIRIWVCVSDNFEMKTLAKAMIESATGSGKAWDLQHLDAIERRLWELLSKKRYLIVMDDVWNDHQDKWFELRDVLSCGSAGSSVVVTTRQKKVADLMTTLPCHCLEGLSDEHCWALLQQRAFGPNEEVSPELEIIGKQIVNKCVGVPLAAITLGGILRFKRKEEEWIYVRDNDIWKLSPEESLIVPALRLSYHHLPLELRQCFAYFAAFPKDHYIEKDELIILWMAHGYISSKGALQVEDVGNHICNELLLRSLLQTNVLRPNEIGMHDLVHDLAESIMENKVPGVQSERGLASASTIREVNLLQKTILFPKTFQQDMNITSIVELPSLRVLNAKAIKDLLLPPSIGNLKHLRSLNLSNSEIQTLPNSLCTLWNLQILNLDGCVRLAALPKKLTSLHNLRHLCLWDCESLCEMPAKMRELNDLKTLSMFVVGFKRGNKLDELEGMNLGGKLHIRHLERVKDHMDAKKAKITEKNNLRELRLSWERNALSKPEEEVDEKVLEALEPHPNLEYLHVRGFSGRYLPSWMTNASLQKIVHIYIWDCKNCKRFPKLGELPHLETLSLRDAGVEYIIDKEGVGSGLPAKIQFVGLRRLGLIGLPNLKGFSKEQGIKDAFPNLESLLIQDCPSLILPPLSSLQKLESLTCSSSTLGLLSEEDIPSCLGVEIEESLACIPIETLSKFSKVRTLAIMGAKDISVTREGLQALKELTCLYLQNCSIRSLPEGMLRDLTALFMLNIWDCREIVELPEDIKQLHNLSGLSLYWLPKMTRLPQAFQHLTLLDLRDLPELKSLPDQLPSLTTLKVTDCPKIVTIPALPNLEELTVTGCPQLERRYKRGSGEDWHKIAHVRRIYISPE